MKNQVFHIAGGGIAGLASALAVSQAGGSAIIMEKAPEFEAIGAGLQLGPNAVRALQKLGAWEAVEPTTIAPSEIQMRDGRTGKLLKRIRLGHNFESRFGQPYRVALRADLHSALIGVANTKSAISIQTNAEVIAHDHFDGFAMIAADGLWSQTREALFANSAAVLSSDAIFRSLVPLPEKNMMEYVVLWLFPGGHVVQYPVGNPAKLNLVAVTQGAEVQMHFANACDELREVLAFAKNWSKWPAAYVQPLQHWNKANLTLIGDAAHGTLPYLAQGAAMALEDAAALGEILKSQTIPEIAFKTFRGLRQNRTKKLHAASLRAGRIYHADGLTAALRNGILKTIPGHLLLQQMAWIYSHGI